MVAVGEAIAGMQQFCAGADPATLAGSHGAKRRDQLQKDGESSKAARASMTRGAGLLFWAAGRRRIGPVVANGMLFRKP
jgi:hypothetical protein